MTLAPLISFALQALPVPNFSPVKAAAAQHADPPAVFTRKFWMDMISQDSSKAVHGLLQIIFIIVLFAVLRVLIYRLITKTMDTISNHQESSGRIGAAARSRTLAGLLKSVTAYVLVFLSSIMILIALGVNPWTVVSAASVIGLAVGFGAQKLVKDVISGFFILLEDQFAVGEYITVGTSTGVVDEIGMRTTRLRDEMGRLVIISNGDISTVINHSRGAVITTVEISVAPDSDINKVCVILREVGASFAKERAGVLAPFVCDGVAAMDGTKVTLRMIGEVEPQSLQEVQSALRRHVFDALVEKGVQIA